MNTKNKSSNSYKQQIIADLKARGVYAVCNDSRPDWLTVGRFDSPTAETYLVATAQLSARPTKLGIKGGRISRLTISRHYRTNCTDLFLGLQAPLPTEIYKYGNGAVGVSYVEHHPDAQQFYDALLGIMN